MNPSHSTNKDSPLVSIILCTYNRAHLVKRAIASVLIQCYRNWELIIVDDGSMDQTRQLVLPIVTSNPRIKYVYHSNQGVARSRNVGMALAAGRYTTFPDSDDEYRENHLSVRIRAMQKNPSLALLYGGIEYVGPVAKQNVPGQADAGSRRLQPVVRWRSRCQLYLLTAASIALPALMRSSGTITGWISMLALNARNHGSAIAGICEASCMSRKRNAVR